MGLALLGLVASVPLGLAGTAALAVMDASERLAERTAELAMRVVATGEPVQAHTPALWSDDLGRLLWARMYPADSQAPDAIRVAVAAEIPLPLLSGLPLLSHWTIERSATARRIAQTSLNARAIPPPRPDPALLATAYEAAFGRPLGLAPEDYDTLSATKVPLDGWLAALAQLEEGPTPTYGAVAERPVPVAMLFQAAAEAVDAGLSRNVLITIADRLGDHPATMSPDRLVDVGGNGFRTTAEAFAVPSRFDAALLLSAVARNLAAGQTLEFALPRRGTAFSAAAAQLTVDPDPMPVLAGARRPPLALRLPAGRLLVEVELVSSTSPAAGRIRIPLAVSVGSGEVEAAEPACRVGAGGPVPQQVRVLPGTVDVRFAVSPEAGPATIYEDARARAWLLGEGVVRPQAVTELTMGGAGDNPTMRMVREPRDLSVVLREMLTRADVRVAVGDAPGAPEVAGEESHLRLALADLVQDAAGPIENYVRSVATAFGLPVEGVVVEAGAASCHAAELVD